MVPWELIQIGLGLAIPFLLLPHIVNTRIAHVVFGVEDNYLYELARLWPASAILQSTLLLIVWLHGCIGIHFWLRLHKPYRAAQPVLLFIAIALPLAALGGFMVSGRTVASSIENAQTFAKVKELTHWPNAADADSLDLYRWIVRFGFAGVLLFVALCMCVRYIVLSLRPKNAITYTGGPTVQSPNGPTLLEISRMNKIPHASVCGGRARCSTCRVRIDEGASSLTPPGYPEAITLASIAAPRNVRLACQVRPASALTVTRLLRPASTGPKGADLQELELGRRREGDGRDVSRPARLHPALAKPPALRRGLHPERVLRGRRLRHPHARRLDRQVPGRRPARRIRPAPRRGGRLPAGAAGGARHRPRARHRQCQARASRSASRCASAWAFTPAPC